MGNSLVARVYSILNPKDEALNNNFSFDLVNVVSQDIAKQHLGEKREGKASLLEFVKSQDPKFHHSSQSKILNAHLTNSSQRFYVDFFVENVATEAQIDSGADVSIISENIVDLVHPDWKSSRSADPVSLSGVTGKSLGEPKVALESNLFLVDVKPSDGWELTRLTTCSCNASAVCSHVHSLT